MSKLAVCVGNNYPGTNAELSGCVNDANDWATLLDSSGYSSKVMVEATKQEILEQLTSMVSRAKYGDRIVFTYSGHGTWIPDQNGDEADHRDEVLCMADYMQGGLLIDDELQSQVFSRLPFGSGILFLSDSCFSGTVSRFVGGFDKARFISPSLFTNMSLEEAESRETLPVASRVGGRKASLISGCSDLESSYDAWFNGRANGAFTRAAIDTYQTGISLISWHKAIRTMIPNDQHPQSPNLSPATLYRKYAKAL